MISQHYLQAIAEGNFTWGVPVSALAIMLGSLALIAIAAAFYWKTTRPIGRGWKAALIGLRSATLLLLGFCLLEPGVQLSKVTPQETYVAVLVDDSQSMSIQDQPNQPSRHQQALNLLYQNDNLVGRLSENFQVRTYRFSDLAQRIAGPEGLTESGGKSALGAGISHVMGELSSFPLAGLVLVTDGADNTGDDPLDAARTLVDNEIPAYVVGLGAEDIERDIHIVDVSAAKSLLEGSIYTVDVTVSQQGFDGQSAQLTINSRGSEVASRSIRLGDAGTSQRYTLELSPDERKILVYDIDVEIKPGETIAQNNHHTFFIDNREKPPLDVLYVEGQPRNEYKFIGRAIKGDDSLRLATYLQTGPRKFLRQGIKSPEELAGGFPKTARELYQYEAIIFGNVERSFFSEDQVELVQDFVGKRGGGFLLVGGLQESFIDSPVADLLPVELVREMQLPSYLQGGARRGDHPTGASYAPQLTRNGEYSPILKLASADKASRERWRNMPELEGVYVTGRAKPGATVLMQHPTLTYRSTPLPILSLQRYGAGRSMVLATASTWRWQMMQPHDDQTHERVWRQMLRWLATESEQRVTINLDRDNYSVGDTVNVTARFLDEEFEPENDALLWLNVTSPAGDMHEQPMTWELEKDGTYTASMAVEEEGVYDLEVRVPSEVESELATQAPLIVTQSRREFLQADMDGGLLRRLAAMTEGRFYDTRNAGQLVDDLTFSPNAYSQKEVRSIWDQPLFLLLIVGMACLEWAIRRFKGLS